MDPVNTENIPEGIGKWKIDFYKVRRAQSLLMWDADFYQMAGFRIMLKRNPVLAFQITQNTMYGVLAISFGCLVLPSLQPELEGINSDRLGVLAVGIIAATYNYIWIQDSTPGGANIIIEYTSLCYIYIIFPLLHTLVMVICGGCCSVNCRKWLDFAVFFTSILSFSLVSRLYWSYRRINMSEAYCDSMKGPKY